MVSHPLSMREALGSIPSVSILVARVVFAMAGGPRSSCQKHVEQVGRRLAVRSQAKLHKRARQSAKAQKSRMQHRSRKENRVKHQGRAEQQHEDAQSSRSQGEAPTPRRMDRPRGAVSATSAGGEAASGAARIAVTTGATSQQSDSCGVRTHALADWRLKPAP